MAKESEQIMQSSLVSELLKQKKSDRFWKNFRFFVGLLFIIIVFSTIFSQAKQSPPLSDGDGEDYVSLIRLDGLIAPGNSFSAEYLVPVLEQAMKDEGAKGVILDINSGGGTPVQSAIIHDAVVRLKKKHNKKIVVVGEDSLASGAYFVAVAADKIFVNANSITGSIGVVMKGFGFQDLIKKIGVQRRVYMAGNNKDRLDPFLPQTEADIEKVKQITSEVHQNFIEAVKNGRGDKLKGSPEELFSGDFWTGERAVSLGLVDGLGDLYSVMESEFEVYRYRDYTDGGSLLKSLTGKFGTSIGSLFNEGSSVKVMEQL